MKNQKNTQSTPAKKSSKELYVEYQRVLAEEKAEAKQKELGLKPTAAQKNTIKELQKEYKQFLNLSVDLPYKIEGVLKVNELVDPYDAEMYFPGDWLGDQLVNNELDTHREAKKLEQVLESKLKPHRIKFNALIEKSKKLANELQMDWHRFVGFYLNKRK